MNTGYVQEMGNLWTRAKDTWVVKYGQIVPQGNVCPLRQTAKAEGRNQIMRMTSSDSLTDH